MSSLGAICNRRLKITQMNLCNSCFKGYERNRLAGSKQRCPENSQPSLMLGPKNSQLVTSSQVLRSLSWFAGLFLCWPLSEIDFEQVKDGHININTVFPSSTVTHFSCVPTVLGSSTDSLQCPVTPFRAHCTVMIIIIKYLCFNMSFLTRVQSPGIRDRLFYSPYSIAHTQHEASVL